MWVAGEEVFKGQHWLSKNCVNCIFQEDCPAATRQEALVIFGNALQCTLQSELQRWCPEGLHRVMLT